LLFSIVTYSYLLIPLIFLLTIPRIKEKYLLILTLYGILFFCFLNWYELIPKQSRKYSQAIFTFLEFAFFSFFFWRIIKNKLFKKAIIIISFLFILFQIFYVITFAQRRLDSIPIGIETIFIFVYIFYFFYEFSRYSKEVFIYNHYAFWIAVGVMIYLGGSFFFYILINHLDQAEVDKFGYLTYIAEIIKNILFALSIIIYKKFPMNINQTNPKKIPKLDMI
jgi:hypothetical protein